MARVLACCSTTTERRSNEKARYDTEEPVAAPPYPTLPNLEMTNTRIARQKRKEKRNEPWITHPPSRPLKKTQKHKNSLCFILLLLRVNFRWRSVRRWVGGTMHVLPLPFLVPLGRNCSTKRVFRLSARLEIMICIAYPDRYGRGSLLRS